MASIRRTLSPAYHDRSYQSGGSLFSGPLLSHKMLSNEKSSSPAFVAIGGGLRRFLLGLFQMRYSRKGQPWWKQSILRCLLFFLLGFVYGMAPFGGVVDDVRNHNFSFDSNSLPPPRSLKVENFAPKRDEVVLDTVNLGVSIDGEKFDLGPRKQLIVVTPTYNRAVQAYYLNRLAQALRLVPPPLLWIVVEMNSASMETADILRNTGVMYRHLVCTKNLTNIKDRGVHQRNTALKHIEHHKLDGIVYFADDDNIYSLKLFQSLREISRFGTWPVAMLAQRKNKAVLEGPVCNGSLVIGWHTNEKSKRLRRFHVDMSGFAFNSTILWDPKRWRRPTLSPIRQLDTVKEGFQETTFIEQVVEDESQMESIIPSCSHILNWHLHLETRDLVYPPGWMLQNNLDAVLPFNGGNTKINY